MQYYRSWILLTTTVVLPTMAQTNAFCSTTNTGVDFSSVYAQFQSKGLCAGTCAGYAFAILQGFECWCSDYFPATQASSSLCNTECPGYASDNCGGTLNGAFEYYQLAQASGTAAASTSTSSTTSTTSSTTSTHGSTSTSNAAQSTTSGTSTSTSTTPPADPVTVVVTQTATPQAGTSTSTNGLTSTKASSGTPTSTSRKGTASSTTSAGASLQSGTQQLAAQSDGGFFDSPGKVAGTFVAVGLIAAAIIAGALFFIFRRRNRRNRADSAMAVAALNRKTSSTSTMEGHSGISQDGRSRHGSISGMMGYGREKASPTQWAMEESAIVPVDQRLNPHPMLMRFDSNYSRHSLRDDEDYSRRVLTVTNPSN